jgi:hypothetical protein
VFGDSTFIAVELYYDGRDKYWKTGIRVTSTPDTNYNLGSLEHVSWTGRNVLFEYDSPEHAIRVVGGECDHGSEGYIAVVDIQTGQPRWILHFDESNPFDFAEVKKPNVIAHSTSGYLWTINMLDPTQIRICKS